MGEVGLTNLAMISEYLSVLNTKMKIRGACGYLRPLFEDEVYFSWNKFVQKNGGGLHIVWKLGS